jgi:hypothetical protein
VVRSQRSSHAHEVPQGRRDDGRTAMPEAHRPLFVTFWNATSRYLTIHQVEGKSRGAQPSLAHASMMLAISPASSSVAAALARSLLAVVSPRITS